MRRYFPAVLTLFGFLSSPVFAQQITGRVTDQQGAVIPDAAVTVRNQATGVDTSTKTTAAGVYTVPYLQPGIYTVNVGVKGFKTEQKTNVPLEQNQVSTVDFVLQLGSVNETISVKAEQVMLDFQRVSGGDTLTAKQISSLPIVSFNPFYNVNLFAGAKQTYGLASPTTSGLGSHPENLMSVNNGGFDITIDGLADMQAYVTASAYTPPINMIQEMKVTTTPFDASMGFKSGGQVAMALKSGTNALHGSLNYEGVRQWLNANTWKNNNLGRPRTGGKEDTYGIELDGPIVIPHAYNGHNKTFLMLGYNYNEAPGHGNVTSSVPDPTWLKPTCTTVTDPNCFFDFSNLRTWTTIDPNNGGSGLTYYTTPIFNPYTGRNVMEGSTQYIRRDPFPNNHIPYGLVACGPQYMTGTCSAAAQANYNLAKNLLSYFPQPNLVPSSGNTWQNNHLVTTPAGGKQRNLAGKIDYNFNDNSRAFLTYTYWDSFSQASGIWGRLNPADNAGAHYNSSQTNQLFSIHFVHIFSPTLIAEFKGNVGVRRDTDTTGPGQGFDPTTLGFPHSLLEQDPDLLRFPRIGLGGFGVLGSYMGLLRFGNIMNLAPSVTWVKGAHSIRAGTDVRYFQLGNRTLNGTVGMALNVGGGWTGNPDVYDQERAYCGGKACTNYPTGNSIASLLLGTWDSGTVNTYIKDFQSRHYLGFWFQDDWKVTPKLTLNLGLRYDLPFTQQERFARNNWGFDYSTPNSVVNSQLAAAGRSLPNNGTVVGGLMFAGVNGNPTRAFLHIQKNLIEPRIGVAYAINKKTVLHIGVARTAADDLISVSPAGNIGFTSSTGYIGTTDNSLTPLGNLANPFPTGLVPSPGASLGPNAGIGNDISFVNPDGELPTYWHFNLTIQRQLSSQDSIDFGYQGNRMYGGSTTIDINHYSTDMVAQCDYSRGGDKNLCDNTRNFVTNPFYGLAAFQGTSLGSATTISRLQFTRPYPQFNKINESWVNTGRSSYDSLQVTERHRFQYGLTATTTYTFSKVIVWGGWADYANGIPSKSLDSTDIPHRFTINGSYQLPVGKGRKFLGSSHRLLDSVVGGWDLAATFMRQSGMPQLMPNLYFVGGNGKTDRHVVPAGPSGLSTENNLTLSGTRSIRGFTPCAMYYDANNGGKLTWEPVSVAYGCSGQPNFIVIPSYGINRTVGDTGIRMGGAQNFDANVAKTFSATEKLKLTVRLDAFNVLNHPMWVGGTGIGNNAGFNTNPASLDFGTITIGGTNGIDQSNAPRNLMLSAKITW